MTLLDDTVDAESLGAFEGTRLGVDDRTSGSVAPPPSAGPDEPAEGDEAGARIDVVRPALAAALSAAAAGVLVGGIFDSWAARLIGVAVAMGGAAVGGLAVRARRHDQVLIGFPVLALVVSALAMVPTGNAPTEVFTLVGDAIAAGRALTPPVPFDPGWIAIIVFVVGGAAYVAAHLALVLARPRLAVVVPLPITGMAAITQPESAQLVAGISGFVLVLAAFAVLFGEGPGQGARLGADFELARALRALAAGVPVVVLLVVANSTSFLFPEPTIDLAAKAQRPRPVPQAASADRVLFEVRTASTLTGPWRTGVLDVYDDDAWKLPPVEPGRLRPLPGDGGISEVRAGDRQLEVAIVVRDLGDAAVLPTLGGTTSVAALTGADVVLDARTLLVRVPSGRVPANTSYTLRLPAYPTDEQLTAATSTQTPELRDQAAVPAPPPFVATLLDQAPRQPWARLQFLRRYLFDNVTAEGGGVPIDVPVARVDDLLDGSKKGSPYEVVAAEALLARWAGLPSRVGFGFDGLNAEGDLATVRPRNAAQWLEVHFDGFGWVPLVGTPKKAQSDLTNDPNARFTPSVLPSDDVAVEVYVPYRRDSIVQSYERVRTLLVRVVPWLLLLMAILVAVPAVAKARRAERRRAWAVAQGPREVVAVEYAEFRDLATDLDVGDQFATPLEYLFRVRPDDEHTEFAWLASRVLYGDLRTTATATEAEVAQQLGAALRRRLRKGQPLLTRLLSYVSQASIVAPYTTEIPNARRLVLPRPRLSRVLRRRRRPVQRGRLLEGRGA